MAERTENLLTIWRQKIVNAIPYVLGAAIAAALFQVFDALVTKYIGAYATGPLVIAFILLGLACWGIWIIANKIKFPGVFGRLWLGEERLWKAWWIYFTPVTIIFAISRVFTDVIYHLVIIGFIDLLWSIFISISIWRCSKNTNWNSWSIIVRILIVLLWIGVITSVFYQTVVGTGP